MALLFFKKNGDIFSIWFYLAKKIPKLPISISINNGTNIPKIIYKDEEITLNNIHALVKNINDSFRQEAGNEWSSSKAYGRGAPYFKLSPLANKWISQKLLFEQEYFFAIKCRTQSLLSRRYRYTPCPCGYPISTQGHILHACPRTMPLNRTRHNDIVYSIFQFLQDNFNYQIILDSPIDHQKNNLRPDIQIITDSHLIYLDVIVACEDSYNDSLLKAHNSKLIKYSQICEDHAQSLNLSPLIIPVTLGTTGSYLPCLPPLLTHLGFSKSETKGVLKYIALKALKGSCRLWINRNSFLHQM